MFFAAISQSEFGISNEEIIAWDTDVINPGGNYDTLYGSYTAPVHGFYHFTAQKESNNNRANFFFVKEGERVTITGHYNEHHPTPWSTSSVILELQAGERVQIENIDSTIIYGVNSGTNIYRSWFSGFLLYGL